MSIRNLLMSCLCSLFIACALLSLPAFSQDDRSSSQAQNENTVEGTVVSSSSTMFVVKSDDNQYHLFTFDSNTTKPPSLPVGTRVSVTSIQGDQTGARLATDVEVLTPAAGTAQSATENAAPLPPSVHKVENKIEQQTHRWRVGGRVGAAFDPELFLFGVHMQVGPIFNRNLFFRPNAEFDFGEITDMVALNLEVAYRMQAFSRTSQWAPYFGGGPSLNFIHQSFQTQAGQGENISFGNFNYKTGFNVLMGVQNRSSTFFEVKASLWSQPGPVLRLIVGKNF
jgi:hypothetical protein